MKYNPRWPWNTKEFRQVDPETFMIMRMVGKAKERPPGILPTDLTPVYVKRLWSKNRKKICPICSMAFIIRMPIAGRANMLYPTLDEVMHNLGHAKNNVGIICFKCNGLKRDLTHWQIARKIIDRLTSEKTRDHLTSKQLLRFIEEHLDTDTAIGLHAKVVMYWYRMHKYISDHGGFHWVPPKYDQQILGDFDPDSSLS